MVYSCFIPGYPGSVSLRHFSGVVMPKIDQTEEQIKQIKDIFLSFDLTGSKSHLLESLARYEQQTVAYIDVPGLSAIIRWHKNLFLQMSHHFSRAEQLLDEAIDLLEDRPEPIFKRWKLKIYLSLGYVHEAQWNYLDAKSYLKDAEELALSDAPLNKFLGEIYSLLSKINHCLGRYNRAKRYVALEKETSQENYATHPSDESMAEIYAYALVNYSRITRLVGLVDQRVKDDTREAIDIFTQSKNEKVLLLARLEAAEFKYLVNQVVECLEISLNIEPLLKSKEMYKELMQTWFLTARTYRKLLDYEQAELKLNDLFALANENQLENESLMADALFEMGAIQYAVNEEANALEYFRKSAKLGMILGIKNIIIRAFEAVRSIDRHKASDLLTADLVYEDAMFVRNRLNRTISPFRENRAKAKLFASTLFVDIVDFSRMMKKSDEDMVIRMVDELIDRMYLIIYQHNGYIDKFLGDGFMAIFEHGFKPVPEVALNAVTAGMDIHRALKHKNRKLRNVYGSDKNIQVRIGISSGEIYAMLLGNYIKTEFTYLGNSVNLASKLESRATEQCMLIDNLSYDLVKERIISEPEHIFIPGLGKTEAYKVLRLARMHDRAAS